MTSAPEAATANDVADALSRALADAGTTFAFGVPGGGPNLDVVGAFGRHGIDFVLAHSETAACIMASTWGSLTGSVSAAVVTRGPGAAAAVNGAAQATLDRQPLVLITDTVPAMSRDRVPHQRVDQRAMLKPVSKASRTLGCDSECADLARDAIELARAWPPGAVHLDYDTSAVSTPLPLPQAPSSVARIVNDIEAAAQLITGADRPVVIVGLGAHRFGLQLRSTLEAFGAPVLSTYQGIGLVDTESDIAAGLFTNGASESTLLEQADLIIAIGLDMVEPIPAQWSYRAPVVAISLSPTNEPYLPIDVELIVDQDDLDTVAAHVLTSNHSWPAAVGSEHRRWVRNQLSGEPTSTTLRPVDLVQAVAKASPAEATITVDAGAHFLAIMPLWPVSRPQQLLISNGLATMGYAVPAAIGAALARPNEPVVAFTGDGGLGMCLAELETIVRRELPITIVVFNDSVLSLIAIKQRPDHGDDTVVRYAPTDFKAIANAMGMPGVIVSTVDEVSQALGARDNGPLLIDARIDPASYPHLIRVTRGPRG